MGFFKKYTVYQSVYKISEYTSCIYSFGQDNIKIPCKYGAKILSFLSVGLFVIFKVVNNSASILDRRLKFDSRVSKTCKKSINFD